jgi:hypothetical protein
MRQAPALFAAAATLLASNAAEAAGTLATVTPELAKALGAVPAGAVVVAGPLASDQPATKGDELAARVAAQLAGRLGSAVRAHPQTAPLAVARALAGRSGALVFVHVEIAKGELRVTADVYPVLSNGWDRLRNPAPPPKAHGFASATIDAEVRSFLPAVTLEHASVHKAKLDEPDLVALGCGDVDADGGMELVVVSRSRVQIGHVRGGRFVASKSAAWSSIASRVPVPMREPLAGAIVVGTGERKGHLFVGTTDRGGVELDETLATRAPIFGVPVTSERGGGCAAFHPEASALAGPVVSCLATSKDRDVTPMFLPLLVRYDAFAALELVGRDGGWRTIVAAREPSAKLHVRREGSCTSAPGRSCAPAPEALHAFEGIGAQIALGDLDEDGVVEVVASADAGDDAISVWSWDGGPPRPRLKVPAPAGVRALAVCPPEVRGVPAVVAAVGNEVWIVR